MPKDRGAEQGDVDGPLDCSLTLGMVAAETRMRGRTTAAGRARKQDAEGPKMSIGWACKTHRS